MSIPGSDTWRALLRRALICLEGLRELGIAAPEWTLGGGTVLMVRYQHRLSRDIDIFLHDAQVLPALSPRVNAAAAALTSEYDEGSSFLKLAFDEGEVDFIVAPSLLGLPPKPMELEQHRVLLDCPAEILAKKLFYRAASLKVRDLLDLGVVLQHDPAVAALLRPVLDGKAAQLQRRTRYLAPSLARRAAAEIVPLSQLARVPDAALATATRFIEQLS